MEELGGVRNQFYDEKGKKKFGDNLICELRFFFCGRVREIKISAKDAVFCRVFNDAGCISNG